MRQDEEEDQILKAWFIKRRRTTILGVMQRSLFAFEYSAVAVSALYYYRYTLKVHDPKLFYSISMAVMFLTAASSAMFIGRYMDRTRHLRRIAMTTALFSIIGNAFYTIPYSRYFPIIARALCGISDGIQPAMAGEFARVYTKEEFGKVLSIYQISASVIYALAPCTPALFTGVHFFIGPIEINQYNCISLVLLILVLIYTLLVYINVTDLTKEAGYQVYLAKYKNNDDDQDKISLSGKPFQGSEWNLTSTLTNANLLALISTDGFISYIDSMMEIMNNMIGLYNFSWNINRISVLTGVAAIIFSAANFTFQQRVSKGSFTFYLLFIVSYLFAIMELSLATISINILISVNAVKVILFVSCIGLNILFGFGSGVYSKWLIFSLVPANSKSIVESHRYVVAKSFMCCGYFTAFLMYQESFYGFTALSCVCFSIVGFLLLRRSNFQNR